ncbi:hypothetical protein [Pseudomonas tohonis]|uniref:hypothetical protein n=1 Tax=Pseudomonas tohonis TaxID=2725477 RepID=UPI001F1FD7B1|nr:hypothetical protein [Pseudomonas tohonis]
MTDIDWKSEHEKLLDWAIRQEVVLRKEIASLRERLEIKPGSPYDGIYCRDATIKALEQRLTEMNGALIAEEARMEWLCDNYKGHGGGDGHHISVFIPADSEDLRDMIDQAIAKEVEHEQVG